MYCSVTLEVQKSFLHGFVLNTAFRDGRLFESGAINRVVSYAASYTLIEFKPMDLLEFV